MTEHQIQAMLFSWIDLKMASIPELACAFAVPNGAYKSKAMAGKFKAEGLRSGVPDVVLAVLAEERVTGAITMVYGSLYIEMKTPTTYPKPNQREWADRLEERGMKVVRRCTSWQDAAREMLVYLGHEVTRQKFPELFVS